MIEMQKKKETPRWKDQLWKKKETEHKLDQLYKNLEQEWHSIKLQSTLRTLHRTSSSTESRINNGVKTLSLLGNSPRTLMSSLQQYRIRSPSDEVTWKVRNNDLAVMEILRDRRAAIESGKLRRRRLFEEAEDGNVISEAGFEGREETCSGCNNGLIVQEWEVRSVTSYDSDDHEEGIGGSNEELHVCRGRGRGRRYCSYSSYGSTSSCDNIDEVVEVREVKEGEKVVAKEELVKRGVIRGSRMTVLGWFAVALIVCAVCITSARSFSGCRNEDEVMMILVPT